MGMCVLTIQHTVKALYFMVVPMNTLQLEFNFTDFACYIVTVHCQNVCVVFNFTETVHTRKFAK